MGTAASIQTSHPSQEQNNNKDENTISAPSWLTRRKSIKKKDIKEKMKARVIENLGIRKYMKRFAGTSAGSIFTLLFAIGQRIQLCL